MPPYTDDLRIRSFDALSTPAEVLGELPCSEAMSSTVGGRAHARCTRFCTAPTTGSRS